MTDVRSPESEMKAMRAAQRHYEVLVNSVDGIVWEADPKTFEFTFVSQQAERLLGYPVSDWLATPSAWLKYLHPDDREEALRFCMEETLACRDHVFEYRMFASDGRVVWLQDRVTVVSENGQPTILRGVMLDITARKEADQMFRALLEAAPDAMVIVNPEGRITLVNSQTEKLFGWNRDELLGETVEKLIPGRFRGVHEKHRDGYAATPRVRGMGTGQPLYGLRKDGSEFPVEISLSPMATPAGRVITAAIRDASERKRAEEALLEGQKRLNEAQEIAHIGSWEWNITENRVRWTDELFRIYGLKPGEVSPTYEGYLSRVHPDDRARVNETVQRAYREPMPFEFEERVIRPSGEVRWLMSSGRVTRDARGQPVRMTGVCQDITERKRVSAELAARAEALQRSNEELEHFAYVASHDLQEPLRTVASYTQLLQRRANLKDAKSQEYGQFINDAVKRMQDLISDLLAYSRVGRRNEGKLEQTPLSDALNDALANLGTSLRDSGAHVTQGLLPVVTADRGQLTQVFQNLISNAIKFRGERPLEIRIGAERDADRWIVSVRDNGIGIDRSHFDKMFVLFQRLHSRESYPGTGLGLAICKKIVTRHGGRIWVESEGQGRGTTFRFTLPDNPT